MTQNLERTARCACGKLELATTGDPERVSSCSCTDCQRRTGSVFGVTAFFADHQVSVVSGSTKTFTRGSDSGRTLTMNFCPECGTTMFWHLAEHPGRVVVAVGCFADPNFPAPERNVFAKNKHHWVQFPSTIKLYPEAP